MSDLRKLIDSRLKPLNDTFSPEPEKEAGGRELPEIRSLVNQRIGSLSFGEPVRERPSNRTIMPGEDVPVLSTARPGSEMDFTPSRDLYGADVNAGAPGLQRALASIKITPEGKVNYLKSVYGPRNALMWEGEMYYRPNEQSGWRKFDEEGFEWQDLADLLGPGIEVAPGMAAGMMSANPLVAAGVDTAGNLARQGISELVPGQENLNLMDRITNAGVSGILGGTSQLGVNAVGSALKAAWPQNIIKKIAGKAMNTPEAERILQLGEKMNVPFSVDEITQHPGLQILSGALRRHPISAKVVQEADRAKLQGLLDYLQGVTGKISSGIGRSGETLGLDIRNAYENYLEDLVESRAREAGRNFKLASAESGRQRIFEPRNFMQAVDDMEKKLTTRLGGDATTSQIAAIKNLRNQIYETTPSKTVTTFNPGTMQMEVKELGKDVIPGKVTVDELQRGLEIQGRGARGEGAIFKDLDRAANKRVARRLFGALMKDLDDAIEQGVPGAAHLKKARDLWRSYSNTLDEAEKGVLSTILNAEDGEQALDKLLSNRVSKVQRQKMMNMLNQFDPDLTRDIRSQAVGRILEMAEPSGGELTPGSVPFSPKKFATKLNKSRDMLETLFAGDPEGWAQVQQGLEAAKVLNSRMGIGGSHTSPLQWGLDLIKGAIGSPFNPLSYARLLSSTFAPEKLAKLMMTKEGVENLRTLASPKTKYKAAGRALLNLISMSQRYDLLDEMSQEIQPGSTPVNLPDVLTP